MTTLSTSSSKGAKLLFMTVDSHLKILLISPPIWGQLFYSLASICWSGITSSIAAWTGAIWQLESSLPLSIRSSTLLSKIQVLVCPRTLLSSCSSWISCTYSQSIQVERLMWVEKNEDHLHAWQPETQKSSTLLMTACLGHLSSVLFRLQPVVQSVRPLKFAVVASNTGSLSPLDTLFVEVGAPHLHLRKM